MSTYFTSPEVILLIQIISIIGYLFLAIFTLISYKRARNKTLLYISFGFAVIAVSIILKIAILPILGDILVESEIWEAIFEGTQFIAAFCFFYGLRVIKHRGTGDN